MDVYLYYFFNFGADVLLTPGKETRYPLYRLRYCATNWNVAGSIPDGVTGIFQCLNPSGRTMALGSNPPLTEMSTRNPSWG